MANYKYGVAGCLSLFLMLSVSVTALADVPFNVSIKFIVDASGARPGAGRFNTDDLINAEADAGYDILAARLSELRFQVTEIIDLPTSLSAYSNSTVNYTNLTTIRNLAMASPATWQWRTNAINVYVTGGSGSAISDFPPKNDAILFGQGCTNSPSCLLHELGHSLNLYHTHSTSRSDGSDGCADTLPDNQSWTNKDQMANNSFGKNYSLLTSSQQDAVDRTWSNFMSYHVVLPQDQFTLCQKDRASDTAYDDRAWMLTKTPVYVDAVRSAGCASSCNGSWDSPYANLQDALSAGSLTGKAIVLEGNNYTITQAGGINADVDIGNRNSTARVDRGALSYVLPVDLGNSKNAAVSGAIRAGQHEATLGRKVLNNARANAANAVSSERQSILDRGRSDSEKHKANVIAHYKIAEKNATGDEKLAIQMELGERLWFSKSYAQCRNYYNRVAKNTDQPILKEVAAWRANECQKKIKAGSEKTDKVEQE